MAPVRLTGILERLTMFAEVLLSAGYGTVYALVGVAFLGLGYKVLDWCTPGSLGAHLSDRRCVNATIIVSAGFLGLAGVVFTVIWHNSTSAFGPALLWTVTFGVVGVLLQVAAFYLVEALMPHSVREIVADTTFHPGVVVAASAMLASSVIVCASISG